MEQEEFYEYVTNRYGDKVSCNVLTISEENLQDLNNHGYTLTADDFKNYKHAWLVDQTTCPECGEPLGGLFGYFKWGIVHGEGYCSNCNKVGFRYYHYLGDCKKPLEIYAVSGVVK